jgi:3-isopropylmalate/(R)-2-methylmalate dehydratase large subunit
MTTTTTPEKRQPKSTAFDSNATAPKSNVAARNIVEKIWNSHVVEQLEGHPAVFAIDLMLLHEVTSAQAFQEIEARGLKVLEPQRLVATIDHSIPTRDNRWEIFDEAARDQVNALRESCQRHGIRMLDFDSGKQGIVHVVSPELGLTQPGMTIVCGDSHTSTHGAFGALAFGIGTSEVAHVLATSCLLQQKPKTMRVEFQGSFRKGVFAKDAILKLIAQIGAGGATGYVIEYTGEAIRKMTMEERMTVCNMSIECGARAGLISPDETTFNYLQGRVDDFDGKLEHWKSFSSDKNCSYDEEVVVGLDQLRPMVTWGTNPGQGVCIDEVVPADADLPESQRPLAQRARQYTRLSESQPMEGVFVDWAFVGSCTNGRIEDLRIAAAVLRGKQVNPNVTMYVVPGSEAVRSQAMQEELHDVFLAAGAYFRMPGCSMCLAMNDDKVPEGKRCISSSNRNFVGRQGPGSITHLASPATVAASAVAGYVTSPEEYF